MFGQNDNPTQDQDQNHIPEATIKAVADSTDTGAPRPEPVSADDVPSGSAAVASAATAPMATAPGWQHPGSPLDEPADAQPSNIITPAGLPREEAQRTVPGLTNNEPLPPPAMPADDLITSAGIASNDLVDIKHKALDELSPLVDKLNQPPEEKFRTIMMLIQASDDQALVEKAYEAAHSIEDETVRAQALLDIVNEINYFTQQAGAEPLA